MDILNPWAKDNRVVPFDVVLPTKTKPKKTVWQGHTVDELYDALEHAETGGEQNKWIRTKVIPHGGSTAYGPVQLTKSLVDLYRKNEPQVLTPYSDLLEKFDQQAELFKTHGAEPEKQRGYSPIWDYGGTGFTWSDEEKQQYENMNKAMISHMKTYQPDMDSFISGWRGKDRKGDTDYYERFDNFLNQP